MPAPNVDLVFVIDASESMRPCIDGLRENIKALLQPMQGYISKVRFGVITHSIGEDVDDGATLYRIRTLSGPGVSKIYSHPINSTDPQNQLLTDNIEQLVQFLDDIETVGDEDSLFALDSALDFPFGAATNTKRVVALFSDEPFETGVFNKDYPSKISALIHKIQARHVQLFVAMPDGDTIQQLAETDRSEVELIEGGDGLANVDFKLLLGQMGKSISVSMLQSTGEAPYERALFGQEQMGASSGHSSFIERT
jgi:hypothetical protein